MTADQKSIFLKGKFRTMLLLHTTMEELQKSFKKKFLQVNKSICVGALNYTNYTVPSVSN